MDISHGSSIKTHHLHLREKQTLLLQERKVQWPSRLVPKSGSAEPGIWARLWMLKGWARAFGLVFLSALMVTKCPEQENKTFLRRSSWVQIPGLLLTLSWHKCEVFSQWSIWFKIKQCSPKLAVRWGPIKPASLLNRNLGFCFWASGFAQRAPHTLRALDEISLWGADPRNELTGL